MAPRPVNTRTLALIQGFEGLRVRAYRDAVGVWTIGYGHTTVAGPPTVAAGLVITADDAEAILARDLRDTEARVAAALAVELNDNQFGALVSFAFNVGLGNFRGSSVLTAANARRFDVVPARLLLWNKAVGRVLAGLTKRRAAEGALFALESP